MTFVVCDIDVKKALEEFSHNGFTEVTELPIKGIVDKKGERSVIGNLALKRVGFDGPVRVVGRRESDMVEIDATSLRDLCRAFEIIDFPTDGLGEFIVEYNLKF